MATSLQNSRTTGWNTKARSKPTARRAIDWLGTAGWAAKGVVYLLLAVIAVEIAFSVGGSEQASKQGALHLLADRSGGSLLLGILVFGLFAYAAYRVVTVFLDDAEGTDRVRHAAVRLGSAAVYALAGVQGVAILLATESPDDGNEAPKAWSAGLLSSGVGTAILFAGAVAILAFAGFQLYRGFSRKFMDHLDTPAGSSASDTTIVLVAVIGIVARGIVAGLIGVFLMQAVIAHDPNQAEGLDGSLRELQHASMGPALLALVAAGLAAYGGFCLFSARYRRHVDG